MNKHHLHRVILSGAAAISALPTFAAPSAQATTLGVTHIDGQYYFDPTKNFLSEGADAVLGTGSTAIKLEMGYQWKTKYPWNTNWGTTSISSLKALAQTQPFQQVFSKPLSTYVITAYAIGSGLGKDDTEYWLQNFTSTNAAIETQQFHDLAKYLMQTYAGTGKTFVFENWEGDWALRDTNHDRNAQPTQTQVNNMISWFNARQAGIDQARAEMPNSDVKVFGAVELNRVTDAMNPNFTWATVTNDVLPHTNVDLASYSSYDTEYNTTGANSFANAVSYISTKLPSSAAFGQNLHSVVVGEFGVPEDTKGAANVNLAMNNVINTAVANGMPYAMYWEVYSNELKSGATAPANGNDSAVNGFWMVKPDGTPGTAWHQYRQRLTTSDPARATTTAIKSPLHPVYRSHFDAPGATLSGNWSTGTFGGAMNVGISSGHVQMNVANASVYPYGVADLNIASTLGRGLKPGEFLQFTIRRQNDAGFIGIDAFNTHLASNSVSTNSPLEVYSNGWTPVSFGANGTIPTYDFDTTRTLGLRLDSADGTFATISYYLDGTYSGSWLYKTSQTTLDSFGFFAQANLANAGFEFNNLAIYANALAGDANLDGKVDVTDLGALATNWQQSAQWTGGDFNDDGFVDVSDLGILATNWQSTSGSLDAALAAMGLSGANVPEPTALGLLLACVAVTQRRSRRSRVQ